MSTFCYRKKLPQGKQAISLDTTEQYDGVLTSCKSDRDATMESQGRENQPKIMPTETRYRRKSLKHPPSREILPICAYKDVILEHIRNNPVICIQGETGCGKSTMIPQFILKDSQNSKKRIKIFVTQPRRLACIALAKRVAQDIGETIGNSIGYQISGESLASSSTKLTFTTTGFLLQVLVNDPSKLLHCSHIILDEVHERNVDADLLSLVVKLQKIYTTESKVNECQSFKIIIMSATLQGDLFSRYFSYQSAPIPPTIFVGAKRFKVDVLYLDDFDEDKYTVGNEDCQRESQGGKINLLQKLSAKSELLPKLLSMNHYETILLDTQVKKTINIVSAKFDREALFQSRKRDLRKPGSRKRGAEPTVTEGLDAVTLQLIRMLGVPGESILVFLPGLGEITDLYQTVSQLESSTPLRDEDPSSFLQSRSDVHRNQNTFNGTKKIKYKIFVLHSLIPREEQEEVFNEPSLDTVHVILASNIAESSLTIPKVRIVIDYCIKRQLIYDPRRHVSSLIRVWESKASSQQRLGRTGRVIPGLCIRLVSKLHYQMCLEEFDLPEILTAPLEKLYLQTLQLSYKLARKFTGQAIVSIARGLGYSDPKELTFSSSQLLQLSVEAPPIDSIEGAIESLNESGALAKGTDDATITTLGKIAMHLPLDVRLSRLLYYSIAFGVPVDGIILAACLAAQDPFTLPSQVFIPSPEVYSHALQRSLQTRATFDNGNYSEPLMLRNMVIAWLLQFEKETWKHNEMQTSRSRRMQIAKSIKDFARSYAIVPKRLLHLSTSIVELGARMIRLLSLRHSYNTIADVSVLLNLLSANDTTEFSRRLDSVLCSDPIFLKAVLTISFTPQFLIGSPQIALPATMSKDCVLVNSTMPSKAAKKRKNLLNLLSAYRIDPSCSLIFPNIPIELKSRTTLLAVLKLMCVNMDLDVQLIEEEGGFVCGVVIFPSDDDSQNTFRLPLTSEAHAFFTHGANVISKDWTDLPIRSLIANQYGGPKWNFVVPVPPDMNLARAYSCAQVTRDESSDTENLECDVVNKKSSMSRVNSLPFHGEGGLWSTHPPNNYNNNNNSDKHQFLLKNKTHDNKDIMLCSPTNPCLVNWKVLGFWMMSEQLDNIRQTTGSRKKKKSANAAIIEIEGRCNYRNPVGFIAAYPKCFRRQEENNFVSRGHEVLLGTFVTEQATENSKLSQIEGLTILPQEIGTRLMLACIRHHFDLSFIVQYDAIEGAKVIGLLLNRSRQVYPLTIQFDEFLNYDYECPTPRLTLKDFLDINKFRHEFSAYLRRADNEMLRSECCRQSDAGACIFVDRDVQLINCLRQLLLTDGSNRHGIITIEDGLFELFHEMPLSEFTQDMAPVYSDSYNDTGVALVNKLSTLSESKRSGIHYSPLFADEDSNDNNDDDDFFKPIRLDGITQEIRRIRIQTLQRMSWNSEESEPKLSSLKQKTKAQTKLKNLHKILSNQYIDPVTGLIPPENLGKKALKRWRAEQIAKRQQEQQQSTPLPTC